MVSIERSTVGNSNDHLSTPAVPIRGKLPARLVMPTALLALGLRKLVANAFIPGWQPVAPTAFHPIVATLDALALIAFAVAAITGPRRDRAYVGIACLMLLWVIAFQGPTLLASPLVPVVWLGVAEVTAVATAAMLSAAALSDQDRRWGKVRNTSFVIYGLCCMIFGTSHFVYVDFTSKMIPGWLPAHVALAYLTGAAHFAAGLAIATGLARRSAALLLALMLALFVALVHVPEVFASGGSVEQVTFLLNACALSGSALAVACSSKTGSFREPYDAVALREPA